MVTVVITGGIGSGKTLVCSLFSERGLPVYDSDTAAKALYDSDALLLSEVVALFGTDVLEDGRIDRQKLALRVFGDPEALKSLERLVHPAVFRDFASWKAEQKAARGSELVIYESALALDRELPEGFADEIVFVNAALDERVARACARDGRSEDEVRARAGRQTASVDDPRVTYIIENNGSIEHLRIQVDELCRKLELKYRLDINNRR